MGFFDTYKDPWDEIEAKKDKKPEKEEKPSSQNVTIGECTRCGCMGDDVMLGICDDCVES